MYSVSKKDLQHTSLIAWRGGHIGQGCPKFIWQRATPVVVSWFAGRTWTDSSKLYT